ncbi:hypothetical protein ALQ65_200344 [Pseudomonas syringae pv. coriandricola]|uniref:Uncharacterized protein n=1 Tax=Pseudomonas syringae pv. coriandricola TaxID=264453 RepID=A0A3M3JLS0_9PSED|nr:hypothetical protein ALQ65_200344 [Pseudomonas syringae pv. coriandricola]
MRKLKSMFLLLRDRKNGRFAAAGCPVQMPMHQADACERLPFLKAAMAQQSKNSGLLQTIPREGLKKPLLQKSKPVNIGAPARFLSKKWAFSEGP